MTIHASATMECPVQTTANGISYLATETLYVLRHEASCQLTSADPQISRPSRVPFTRETFGGHVPSPAPMGDTDQATTATASTQRSCSVVRRPLCVIGCDALPCRPQRLLLWLRRHQLRVRALPVEQQLRQSCNSEGPMSTRPKSRHIQTLRQQNRTLRVLKQGLLRLHPRWRLQSNTRARWVNQQSQNRRTPRRWRPLALGLGLPPPLAWIPSLTRWRLQLCHWVHVAHRAEETIRRSNSMLQYEHVHSPTPNRHPAYDWPG